MFDTSPVGNRRKSLFCNDWDVKFPKHMMTIFVIVFNIFSVFIDSCLDCVGTIMMIIIHYVHPLGQSSQFLRHRA
jgi:hypothetical protein